MRNLTVYLWLLVCLFFTNSYAQETFEQKAKSLALKIEFITKSEKELLKKEIEKINEQQEKGQLNNEQANEEKKKKATETAQKIETQINIIQKELNDLVQQKADGMIDDNSNDHGTSIVFGKSSDSILGKEYNVTSLKIYKNQKERENYLKKRTTTQLVFSFGVNNLVTNNSIQNSNFRYLGSHFYEWGYAYNSRIIKDNNLLHAKYGLSIMYNNLRPVDNQYFVTNNDQTNLVTSPIKLDDSRFRNVYLTIPMHLEFDFTKKTIKGNSTLYKTHESFRFGLGGYAGTRIKSKQFTIFDQDNKEVTIKEKGDFNTSNFIYGVSTYIGYGQTSLYLKYDLNPMFKDNTIKQNNISLGLRFDFN